MQTRTVRVVVVDDMRDTRGTIAEFLHATNGIDVVGAAGDQVEASRLVNEKQPDLIVLDLDFDQGISGTDLLPLLREDCPAAKILTLSAYDDAELERQSLEIGADVFIHKENMREVIDFVRALAADVGAGRLD
jgi:DNA-binding NarL/FixJ family response regulator